VETPVRWLRSASTQKSSSTPSEARGCRHHHHCTSAASHRPAVVVLARRARCNSADASNSASNPVALTSRTDTCASSGMRRRARTVDQPGRRPTGPSTYWVSTKARRRRGQLPARWVGCVRRLTHPKPSLVAIWRSRPDRFTTPVAERLREPTSSQRNHTGGGRARGTASRRWTSWRSGCASRRRRQVASRHPSGAVTARVAVDRLRISR